MHLNSDISNALQQIESVKQMVEDSSDPKLQLNTADDFKLILDLLQDPVFRSIIQIQDSLGELNSQISQHPSILPSDFDLNLSGDLILNVPPSLDIYEGDYTDEQRVPSAQLSPRSLNSPHEGGTSTSYPFGSPSVVGAGEDLGIDQDSISHHQARSLVEMVVARSNSNEDERPQSAVSDSAKHSTDLMSSEWTQIEALELVNDGTGLGFGIIGARTSGVIVKTILPGGVADRDQKLQSGDHILQIGDVNLHDMGSEQVASVLRQSGTHVRLVVARPDPLRTTQDIECSTLVPSRLLADPVELERYLIAAGYPEIFGTISTPSTPTPTQNERFMYHGEKDIGQRPPIATPVDLDLPETERFIVELRKDHNGLGITIAGYVCEKEELSGIFVKSISPLSAADISGRINVNDRIIEVDGQSLQGYSNHQAVDVLKQSGLVVTLCLERYLRGPKYDQLQQAIAANELKPSTPISQPSHLIANSTSNSSLKSLTHSNIPIRKNSIPKEDEVHEKPAVPAKKPPLPPTIPALAATRKLAQARDSIENKHLDDTIESSVDDNDDLLNLPVQPRKISIAETTNLQVISKHKYYVEPELTDEIEVVLSKKWKGIIGSDVQIIVAQIRKFAASSGLGISLEGTVDVEGGREVRPHHYIRSILPEGPVGQNGLLRSGDELLEVNGQRLLGMNHLEVVSILKELPQDVRMICGRGPVEMVPFTEETIRNALGFGFGGSQNLENLMPVSDRLVKAKSDGSLATTGVPADDGFSKMKSRSLEPLTGLAMWSSEPQIIELIKGERGLGFSILDYQDPMDQNDTLIVIRSLVPGGVAQLDGRLIPGDRLLFVNEMNLENASLDQAVQALKGAAKGIVRIGVAKPLPMADTSAAVAGKSGELNSSLTLNNTKPDVIQDWHSK